MVAVLSAAGGVGKTCLVATLGRALSEHGRTGSSGRPVRIRPPAFLFRLTQKSKPGVVRTFSSPLQPGQSMTPRCACLSLDAEHVDRQLPHRDRDLLAGQIVQSARGASRVLGGCRHWPIADCPDRLLPQRPTVLVPILPDMSSLARLASLQALVRSADLGELLFLLNQFDPSLPLHLDVRAMLQQQLGRRLLPLVLHRKAQR